MLAFLILLAAACGYRFTAPSSALPEGIQKVRVPVFVNATSEPGVEALFTQALRDQLLRAGRLGGDAEPATVEGRVLAVSSAPVVASPGRLPSYRLSALVNLKLSQGARAVTEVTVSGTEDFPSGADVLWSEANRGAALRRLADSLMRDGAERLASGG